MSKSDSYGIDDITRDFSEPVTVLGVHFSSGLIALLTGIVVVVVLWYGYQYLMGEGFMPTQTMRMQQNDSMLIGNSEHQSQAAASGAVTPSAQSGAPPTSFFQTAVQSNTQGTLNYDPNAASGAPGSLSYMVLNSPDFACATRTPVTDNAWSWLNSVAQDSSGSTSESMKGGVKSDNQLSALLAGH